ncbi:MAG: GDP-mannose 4,6-dehydratase, partial [Gemmatimonadaceae bacterium]|nr:GDP-mannose 4,6-dehydratase [Gemmatimonadaceae bacterium]
MSSAPIAVTGASGYVGSWVVRELLARGATVHATVRDPNRAHRVDHLHRAAEGLPGTLKLFAADLLDEGSFDAAFRECTVVVHTASPF